MTDLRAAVLARCDELEKLARAAAAWRPNRWHVDGDRVATISTDLTGARGVEVVADAHRQVVSHIATWDPPAVFDLVAGAREMCEVHAPEDDPDAYNFSRLPPVHLRECRGCGYWPADGPAKHAIRDCPSLLATARMLGVAVTDA